jgi:hypothetical protein
MDSLLIQKKEDELHSAFEEGLEDLKAGRVIEFKKGILFK